MFSTCECVYSFQDSVQASFITATSAPTFSEAVATLLLKKIIKLRVAGRLAFCVCPLAFLLPTSHPAHPSYPQHFSLPSTDLLSSQAGSWMKVLEPASLMIPVKSRSRLHPQLIFGPFQLVQLRVLPTPFWSS